MIPRIKALIEPPATPDVSETNPTTVITDWQRQLAEAITNPEQLFSYLNLPEQYLDAAKASAALFPLKVTHSYLARIEKGNLFDPLLQQILPLQQEADSHPDYQLDPVGDLNATVAPGLLHKYQSRVLIMPTSVCAIHCRYCFRRHYPYNMHKSSNNWRQALEYISKDRSISEVILSGGDPLSLSNNKLFRLLELIDNIPHIQRIRFHTRYPVVLPARINTELSDYLHQLRSKVVIVIHCNHPNELAVDVKKATNLLNKKNISLLNQSVLLANINDNVSTLSTLSERLFEFGILPYYLHQLDKVAGAQHFNVDDDSARSLLESLRNTLPGYLLPRLVRENSGDLAKQPLF